MLVLVPGHLYELDHIDGDEKTTLQFVQRTPHYPQQGPNCQEVIRVLIDRVQALDKEVRSPLNEQILAHLRQALCLFEARALLRKVEKGQLKPETLPVGADGHFILQGKL